MKLRCVELESTTSRSWKEYFVKNHELFTVLKSQETLIQAKTRRIPIQMKQKTKAEIHKLSKVGHTVKIDKCTSDHFVVTILTAKKTGSL